MPLPAPTVIGLEPENWIDLDKLGTEALVTWIKYPGLDQYSEFWPNWRGCSALGEALDFADSKHTVEDPVSPNGERIEIGNDLLRRLDQGWVFYSYLIPDVADPNLPGEESERLFFYVGKRDVPNPPDPTGGLGVAQFKESHDLQIALNQIVGHATVVAPAYAAMSVGDKVTLRLEFSYDENSDPGYEHEYVLTLEAHHLNRPLEWKMPKGQFVIFDGGLVDARYSIVYAKPTVPTTSPVQRLRIVKDVTGQLPPLAIKDFPDPVLDPERFQDGAILQVPLYPGIQADDVVVLYADSDSPQIQSLRVDPSTLDSRVLEFFLPYAWLAANNGYSMKLTYQYARAAATGRAEALEMPLRRTPNLKTPIVENATADGLDKGHLLAVNQTGGVYVRIPDDAEIGTPERLEMHWQGHASTGSAVVDRPESGTPRRFRIPSTAVPANMRKHVEVFYRLWVDGEGPFTSGKYDLEVRAPIMPGAGWPTIQVSLPANAPPISLAAAQTQGARLTLGAWMFMAPGQRVNVRLNGEDADGGDVWHDVRSGDQELVTQAESSARKVDVPVPLEVLSAFKCPSLLTVYVKTSFDDGGHYEDFYSLPVDLIV
ncbi:hypothetical protein PS3A_18840 [Pseudomonas sp. 3A(2025)]